jgi:DNA-binding LacI/PurR family transcriptional regulator
LAITIGSLHDDQRALLARARVPALEAGIGRDTGDGDAGATLQISHLAARGHRQLGYLTTTDPVLAMFAAPRRAAASRACTELDLDQPPIAELPPLADIVVDDLAAVLTAWTSRAHPVTAVACYNDVCAAACLAAAHQARLTVPSDLAVIGMDDEPIAAFTRPALTTIRIHVIDYAHDLWAHARTALDGRREPEPISSIRVSLIQRSST